MCIIIVVPKLIISTEDMYVVAAIASMYFDRFTCAQHGSILCVCCYSCHRLHVDVLVGIDQYLI